jgi:hypothetical protein
MTSASVALADCFFVNPDLLLTADALTAFTFETRGSGGEPTSMRHFWSWPTLSSAGMLCESINDDSYNAQTISSIAWQQVVNRKKPEAETNVLA